MKSWMRIVGSATILVTATLLSIPATSHASAPLRYVCAKYGYTFALPSGWSRGTETGAVSRDTCTSDGSSPSFVSHDKRMMFGEAVVASSAGLTAATAMRAFFLQMTSAGPAYASGWTTINGVRYFWASGIVANPSNSKGKLYMHAIDTIHGKRLYMFVGMVLLDGKHTITSDPPTLKAAFQTIRFVK